MEEIVYKNSNHIVNQINMRRYAKLCDVTIQVDDGELRAHKVILAANLKYFESMFLGSFQESKKNIITMEGIELTNLAAFISYAYAGEISLTDKNALGLLEVANYLNEDGIKEACVDFLLKRLNEEQACGAYKFANKIDCIPLRNVARQTILSNFEACSQTIGYLDLDFASLKDILSPTYLDVVESQQVFFEGVVRWIAHDAKSRRGHVNDLLDFIDITSLDKDRLLEYLCGSIQNEDYNGVVIDIMTLYNSAVQVMKLYQIEDSSQCLNVIGFADRIFHFQSYDFIERKWSQPDEAEIFNGCIAGDVVLLKHKLYCIIRSLIQSNFEIHLGFFNPKLKRGMLLTSENRILSYATMCACNRFLYLCGGYKEDESSSEQVLRYDPDTGSFETLTPMGIKRSGAAAIFYQNCIHVLGGFDGSSRLNSVEKYDPVTKEWTFLPSMCKSRHNFGVAVLDGNLYACGGYNNNTVEVYDPLRNSWQLIASMNSQSRTPFVVVHEGKLLAIGGDYKKTVEIYEPSKDQWRVDHEMSSGLQIEPIGGSITTTSFF